MSTGWFYAPDFLEHDTGRFHPEQARRLHAIFDALRQADLLQKLTPLFAAPATDEMLLRVHGGEYIKRVQAACLSETPYLDSMDTPICGKSEIAARLASGGAIAAAQAVMDGRVSNAFCAMRPPGHHAERDRAMGFCLYNHVAAAAAHLTAAHGLERVAIVDFDVHHGNGTQHIFEARADVFYISIHEDPRFQYPGTGFETERGIGPGLGATLNVPIMPHGDDDAWKQAFETRILPALEDYRPQFLLLSAGFDGAMEDPLGHMNLTPGFYGWMTRRLLEAAGRHAGGRVVSLLEGGYHLQALGRCAVEHLGAMLG